MFHRPIFRPRQLNEYHLRKRLSRRPLRLASPSAYTTAAEDLAALGAQHHWAFDGDLLDEIGSANGSGSGTNLTIAPIAKDAVNSLEFDTVADRVTLPSTSSINNSAQARKTICGWFEATAFQAPPTRIYGEGTNVTCFQFCMGFGNNLIFECTEPTNFPGGLQIYGPAIVPNRIYHLCGIFLGNAQGNEIKLFVDGIEFFNADPVDRQPDTPSLDARGIGEFGDPAGITGLGGGVVLQQAARDGRYQHWASWGDIAAANLTDTDVRTILFERRALADFTVSSDTEANMQTALNAIATAQGNAPCCIEIETVTGGGNFQLTSDKTFDALASIHFRYNGLTGTLTLINISGGNASIGSAPFNGTIILATRQTLTVTVLDALDNSAVIGARTYIEADTGGDLTAGTVIMNTTTNGSGIATITHDYTSDQPIIGKVRKGSSAPYYRPTSITGPLGSVQLNVTILMVPDD